jgi:hypothetical protein
MRRGKLRISALLSSLDNAFNGSKYGPFCDSDVKGCSPIDLELVNEFEKLKNESMKQDQITYRRPISTIASITGLNVNRCHQEKAHQTSDRNQSDRQQFVCRQSIVSRTADDLRLDSNRDE